MTILLQEGYTHKTKQNKKGFRIFDLIYKSSNKLKYGGLEGRNPNTPAKESV